ncbi:MAG TPA: pyruvate kinase, partial [Thermoplasmata archaeon]|nr:pyruvate kinase [Thermoplasmata archaeon]
MDRARIPPGLASRLRRVRSSLLAMESKLDLTTFGPQRESARNLLHYLAFRRFDLRKEQSQLARMSLSSLGRSESHVLHNLDGVLRWLEDPTGSRPPTDPLARGLPPDRARQILLANARDLLGPTRRGRGTRIMVTLPAEAATDYRLVRELVVAGMDCARINCAHDGPALWSRMIANVRRAEAATGSPCRVAMDLAGPKLRTGSVRPGPAVLKVRPRRDPLGRVIAPATVWLVPSTNGDAVEGQAGAVPVPVEWLARRRRGEWVEVTDAR